MKKLLVLFTLFALAPGGTGMVLTRDSFSNGVPGSDMDKLPTWCYHEDSYHLRIWTGTLGAGESFTTTARFCTEAEAPPYGPGPEGVLYAAATESKQPLTLTVTYPDAMVKAAYPFGSELAGCVVPEMHTTGGYTQLIDAGIYMVTLTNTGTRAISSRQPITFEVRADFVDVNFQQTLCPPEDRRLV